MLGVIAITFREPAIVYGETELADGTIKPNKFGTYSPPRLQYLKLAAWEEKEYVDYLKWFGNKSFYRHSFPLFRTVEMDDPAPPLVNEAGWQEWLKVFQTDPDFDYNAALFLYCALNKPTV